MSSSSSGPPSSSGGGRRETGRPKDSSYQPFEPIENERETKLEINNIISDSTAKIEAGKVLKDLRMMTVRRLKMTSTRQMMTKLIRLGIGTNDVEFEALRIVKEGISRRGRKREGGGLGDNDSKNKREFIKGNRDLKKVWASQNPRKSVKNVRK